jgi:hypothetical protein
LWYKLDSANELVGDPVGIDFKHAVLLNFFFVELLFLPSWNQDPYLSKLLFKGIQFVVVNADRKKLR